MAAWPVLASMVAAASPTARDGQPLHTNRINIMGRKIGEANNYHRPGHSTCGVGHGGDDGSGGHRSIERVELTSGKPAEGREVRKGFEPVLDFKRYPTSSTIKEKPVHEVTRRRWNTRNKNPAKSYPNKSNGQSYQVKPGVSRHDGERQKNLKRKRVGTTDILAQAEDKEWLAEAEKEFTAKFFAASTPAAKESKKRWIVEALEKLETAPFLLSPASLTRLGAVLNRSGMKAADQYLNEAKSLHVEWGWQWTPQLDLTLGRCKRALKRGQGPETRAKEVKLAEITAAQLEAAIHGNKMVLRPGLSYAWAATWMLRAVEAAKVEVGHLSADREKRTVSLWIPSSKTDQKGNGAKRTLGCCGRDPCETHCPYALAQLALARHPTGDRRAQLFSNHAGARVGEAQTVKSWAKVLDARMTGHSARRSGAMYYTRKNMSVQDISFLGRWKSSAVFRYIEDAMQELALNTRQPTYQTSNLKAEVPVTETQPPADVKAKWAVSSGRSGKIAHHVKVAEWGKPLDDWVTACGWTFARRRVAVQLCHAKPLATPVCKKCREIKALRDSVM